MMRKAHQDQTRQATRFIVAKLLNNGEPYTIPTGSRAVINIAKPDGKHVYNTCTYSGSDVTVELTNQALAASGTAYCDIEIRTSDDSQIITSASFTMEIEKSQRDENAILSSNEFTDLENRIKGHIETIENTDAAVKKAELARVTAENARVKAEGERAAAEKSRQENENTRIQQEKQRQQDTSQAVKNAEDATAATKQATKDCKEVTDRAEDALQNQEQLEATLNTATQIRREVSQMQSAVEEAKKQVEQDKKDIDDTIQNSLLASAEKILESVQDYFNRAEALYSSMYLEGDITLNDNAHVAVNLTDGAKSSGTGASNTTTVKSNAKVDVAHGFNKSLAGTYKVTASGLNLRAGAGTGKSILAVMKNGEKVQCYGYYNDSNGVKWLYVVYKNIVGYASSKYLSK